MFSQDSEALDSAPGAPQERSQLDGHIYLAEVKELQRRYIICPKKHCYIVKRMDHSGFNG